MVNIIVTIILAALIGAACFYIIKEKKNGKCIGCPCGGCKECKGCMNEKVLPTKSAE